jgi:polar amino acid transport system permease protein
MSAFTSFLTSGYLLNGALVTVEVSGGGFAVALVAGVLLAAVQLARIPVLSWAVRVFVIISRGTPLLLQLLFVYDVLPVEGITISPTATAVLVLGLNSSTFLSEIFRGAVKSLDRGQIVAAQSVGMTPFMVSRLVILPQAARIALPQLANQCVVLILSSSLASSISVAELTLRSQTLSASSFQVIAVYTASGVIYLVLTSVVAGIQVALEAALDLDRERRGNPLKRFFERCAGLFRDGSSAVLLPRIRSSVPEPGGRPAAAGEPGAAAVPDQSATSVDGTVTRAVLPNGEYADDADADDMDVVDRLAAMPLAAADLALGPESRRRSTPAVLAVRGLHKSYRGMPALAGIDFEVAAGEVVVVMGASGCGKSTLLRVVARLEDVDSGEVLLDGQPFAVDARKRRLRGSALARDRSAAGVTMVFQHFELFQHMTALRNVSVALEHVYRKEKAAASRTAQMLLDAVGLSAHVEKYPRQLSGGQQQRAAIARALAISPRLMLLDEPTSALDPEMVHEVLAVLRRLARSGMTMLVVTHEVKFAREVADKVVIMHNGKIVESGPPQEVLLHPQSPAARRFLHLLEV